MPKGSGSGNTWRNVSTKNRTILWGRAAARCAYPGCRIVLIEPATRLDAEVTFGQAAHIVAHSNDGPRGDENFDSSLTDTYENLILLCGNHHTVVDRQPNSYTVDDLKSWKAEHEAWIKGRTDPGKSAPTVWQTIIQENRPCVDTTEAVKAIAPDVAASTNNLLRLDPANLGWAEAAAEQTRTLNEIIANVDQAERRFAVFSLTAIPMAIHLGFTLTDRVRIRLFHYHRDQSSWLWPSDQPSTSLSDAVWTENSEIGSGPVAVRISLSALVQDSQIDAAVSDTIASVHLQAVDPSVNWLKSSEQLDLLKDQFRKLLGRIRNTLQGRCTSIHLFYAGPTSGAIAIGSCINPRMNPPIHVYEFEQTRSPVYERVLILGGNS